MAVGALGVVFGDIGTSPIYAFQNIFAGPHAIPAIESRVYGAASTVFWTLTLVVAIKYVLIVMRADNDGEGGVMALSALASRSVKTKRGVKIVMTLGVVGAALFYGDGLITPAISVLSAVEGLEVADPGLSTWVVPIAVVVLAGVFLIQSRGAGRIGKAAGPVMLLWFFIIGILGALSVIKTPEILTAVNPVHAFNYISGETGAAFLSLGSVVLCVTGAEALYADMGQFGRGAIRISWFSVTAPALFLTYFGQAALVVRDPAAAANPFYQLVPSSLTIPMVVLATLATIIASQAVISGAFSMTRQAMHLGYLPTMTVRQTSADERGQIYIPAVNWLLMIGVLGLVLAFRSSGNLASAYGIAVTGTFVVTTALITILALRRWRLSAWVVLPFTIVFGFIDLSFFTSNLTKFFTGGWFPLVVAGLLVIVLTTWSAGIALTIARMARMVPTMTDFIAEIESKHLPRATGTVVYLVPEIKSAPWALVGEVRRFGILAEHSIMLHIQVEKQPHLSDSDRLIITRPVEGLTVVVARLGYMERVDIPSITALCAAQGVDVNPKTCTYIVHPVAVEPSPDAHMMLARQRLYAAMRRLTSNPTHSYKIPAKQLVEFGTVIKL